MKKHFVLFIMLFMAQQICFSQSANTLWYKQPAQYFEETLVLGNGKVGASVFGGVDADQIYLNDLN